MTDELHLVKQALTEASNEVISLKKQHATALRKLDELKKNHMIPLLQTSWLLRRQ